MVYQMYSRYWATYGNNISQYKASTIQESASPFRTTTPSTQALTMVTAKQANPVHVNALPVQNTSWSGPPAPHAHVHKLPPQVLKPRDSLALRKVQHPQNGRTSVNRLPLTKQDILSHYSSCFEGIGHFPGELYKFHLKPEHKPARHAPRNVPIHLEDAFKEEIQVFAGTSHSGRSKGNTDWVNSFVIVEKDSGNHHAPNHTNKRKLRICLDHREPHHTCSVDEITAKLQGMTIFTIVDFKKGYWMVVLHPDSRKLKALNHMEFPPDKETMRSFLGMVNFLNRYSAHLAAPLSALTHQAVDYKPSKVYYENINRLKMEVSNMRALPYFYVNAETTLQMDASMKGLGACMIQKGKVVCYASRAFTKTEQNYQNLEREALGTRWGMEKFHYFLYGKEFTLETNQKPLVSIYKNRPEATCIYKKHMIDISPRVQRLIVRSFPYLPFKVVYKKGADIPVADALS